MKIRECMTPDVKTCTVRDSANRAAQLMWENDCGFVVVCSAEGGVAGVVTDRDLCMAAYISGLPLTSIPVSDVMSSKVVTCGPDDDHLSVAARMQERQIRRLPVLDPLGALVGVVALNDLARAAAVRRGQPHRSIGSEFVATTLAEICRPRCPLPEERPKEEATASAPLALPAFVA